MPRKSPFTIELTANERTELETQARKYTSPYRDVIRARVILYAAEGLDNGEIAARIDMPRPIVSKWRKRFYEERLAGLVERPRTGRPSANAPSAPPASRRRRKTPGS